MLFSRLRVASSKSAVNPFLLKRYLQQQPYRSSSRQIVKLTYELFTSPEENLWKGYHRPDQVAFNVKTSDDFITILNT